jgi:hypothetical protein
MAKASKAGLYWLTVVEDANEIVKTCEGCHMFAKTPQAPAAEMMPIPLVCPFSEWGLDMVGKLDNSLLGGHVYMFVAVDKFTKWIKTKLVTRAEETALVNFVESIVCRFGVPHSIIMDNGSNFTSGEFKEFCDKLGIQLKFASTEHPQMNEQVEKANGLICSGIKKAIANTIEEGQGCLGRGTPLCPMELTNNSKHSYARNFVLHDPWR